jgi:phage portal protein BeeE
MTQSLGAQGLVLPELNTISESRICMAFGIDPGMIGTIIGAENSSYANRKAMRESFWNETLKPLYRELQGPLNRALVPEFPGVQQMGFDLSTVGALQPDQDAVWVRVGKALNEGFIGQKEARRLVGLEEEVGDDVFLIPSNLTQTPADDVGTMPEPVAPTREPAVAPV